MSIIPFNLNSYIQVQLTEAGREIHRQSYERMMGRLLIRHPYVPVKEDALGWSKWQAWEFFQQFGPYFGDGVESPAMTEIMLITEQEVKS